MLLQGLDSKACWPSCEVLHARNCEQDPYANAFSQRWRDRDAVEAAHRRIGRGGWVATRNYELDSGAYFINMLWNYYTTPGLFAAERCGSSGCTVHGSKKYHRL